MTHKAFASGNVSFTSPKEGEVRETREKTLKLGREELQ